MSVILVGSAADNYQSPLVLFQNFAKAANVTSSAAVAGTAALNVLTDDTFSVWSPAGSGTGWVASVLDAPVTGICVAIGAHNLGTVGASVRVQNWDGSAWTTMSGEFFPGDDAPILVLNPQSEAIGGVRVLLNWEPGAVVPFIGVLRAARVLKFPTDIAPGYTPANHAKSVEVFQSSSMGGQFFAPRIRRTGGHMSPVLNPVSRSFADATLALFRAHYDQGKPFFWAGHPVEFPDDVALARRADGAGELRPSYRAGGLLADLSLEFEIHGA